MFEEKASSVLTPLPEEGWEPLPERLAEIGPGPELAGVLSCVDRERLSGYDRVELLKATARMVAHYQAELYADIDALHEYELANPDNLELFWTSDIDDMTASEIQVALTLTARAAETHLALAHDLRQRHPRVWESLSGGRIDLAKARIILDETRHLDVDEAGSVASLVLGEATNLTTGQLRAKVARICMTADPESAKKRYLDSLADRKVVRVELTTLMELNDDPGHLKGFGPLVADIARQVVADQASSPHQLTVTEHGEVIWTGVTRRRPTAMQQREDLAVHPTCIYPGCRMPATECDLDHGKAWAEGGSTESRNLAPLCRRDHRRKHAGWRLHKLESGRYRWTSPLGHIYDVTGTDPP